MCCESYSLVVGSPDVLAGAVDESLPVLRPSRSSVGVPVPLPDDAPSESLKAKGGREAGSSLESRSRGGGGRGGDGGGGT